jgi:hypothetical protein
MLVFPQLATGAVSQLPLRREQAFRTLVNRALDGSEIRVLDADYRDRQWELPLVALSEAEWQAIQTLFAAAEGRLQTFLFLEPGENLIEWSETFTDAAWVKSGVSVTEGIGDPFGGTAASELSGAGTLSQTLNIPASLRYAASIWARTFQPGASIELSDGGTEQSSAAIDPSGQWRRYTLSTALVSTAETLIFRVNAPGTVDIYGAQLEAQPVTSAYKKTLLQSGVHPAARFTNDTLADQFTSPGEHAGTIRITWTPSHT